MSRMTKIDRDLITGLIQKVRDENKGIGDALLLIAVTEELRQAIGEPQLVTRVVQFLLRPGDWEGPVADWLSAAHTSGVFLECREIGGEQRVKLETAAGLFNVSEETILESVATRESVEKEVDVQHFVVLCREEACVGSMPLYVVATDAEDAEDLGKQYFRRLNRVPAGTRVMCDLVVRTQGSPLEFWTDEFEAPERPSPIRKSDLETRQDDVWTAPADLTKAWKPLSVWDNHPDFPYTDWQAEVANDDTRQSYIEWVNSKLEERNDG